MCVQKAFLRSWEDRRADRDPSTFAGGHTVEFCISDSGDCPGAALEPGSDDGDDDYEASGTEGARGTSVAGVGSAVAAVFVLAAAAML